MFPNPSIKNSDGEFLCFENLLDHLSLHDFLFHPLYTLSLVFPKLKRSDDACLCEKFLVVGLMFRRELAAHNSQDIRLMRTESKCPTPR
jgi:hypothetical protein